MGEAGDDLERGGAGDDQLLGGPGDDIAIGGHGSDELFDDQGHESLRGEEGNDRFSSRDGDRDVIDCGPGEDVVLADHTDVVAEDCEHVYLSAHDTPEHPPQN
jgi:Ca2+-binding RTX toxin-like protein